MRNRRGVADLVPMLATVGVSVAVVVVQHVAIEVPTQDLTRIAIWVCGGVGAWLGVNTWVNGKKLTRVCTQLDGDNGVVAKVGRIEAELKTIEPRLRDSRHMVGDKLQEVLSAQEMRIMRVEDALISLVGRRSDEPTRTGRAES